MTTQHQPNDDRAAHPAVHRRRRWHRYVSLGLLTLTDAAPVAAAITHQTLIDDGSNPDTGPSTISVSSDLVEGGSTP